MEQMEEDRNRLKSLTECLASLQKVGFEQHFTVTDQGLCVAGSGRFYKPEEVKITNFYRFEGDSDPGDNAILYAIVTKDGIKGTLSDSYGPQGDIDVTEFILEVEQLQKRIKSPDKQEDEEASPERLDNSPNQETGLW